MKKAFIVFTFFFTIACSFGQTDKINIPVHKNMDTASCCYYWRPKFYTPLKIENLTVSKDTLHIRFWQNTQVLDIWTVDYKTFNGQLKNYVIKWEDSAQSSETFISNQVTLKRNQAKKAYNLLLQYDMLIMPTDEKIPGWKKGFDGITYFVEISTPLKYTYKSYWTPAAQGELMEAVKLQEFVEALNKQLKLKKWFSKFTSTLPNGQYSAEGLGILIINK